MSETIDNIAGEAAELLGLLKRGHGRAVLFLRDRDCVRYREIITQASTHNLIFDIQLEDSRAPFIFDVIQATGEPEFYAPIIREALRSSTNRNDLYQLFDLALILAQNGDQDARAAMYERVERETLHDGAIIGADELICLDGVEGFLYVVSHTPEPADDDPYYWQPEWYASILAKAIGENQAELALAELAKADPVVARFVQSAREYKERYGKPKPRPPSRYRNLRNLLSYFPRKSRSSIPCVGLCGVERLESSLRRKPLACWRAKATR